MNNNHEFLNDLDLGWEKVTAYFQALKPLGLIVARRTGICSTSLFGLRTTSPPRHAFLGGPPGRRMRAPCAGTGTRQGASYPVCHRTLNHASACRRTQRVVSVAQPSRALRNVLSRCRIPYDRESSRPRNVAPCRAKRRREKQAYGRETRKWKRRSASGRV